MTDDELRAIEERAACASEGPWRAGNVETWHVFCPSTHANAISHERVLLRMNENFDHADTADFIAAAIADVPALCADLRATRVELQRLRAACVVTYNDEGDWRAPHDRRICLICDATAAIADTVEHDSRCALATPGAADG